MRHVDAVVSRQSHQTSTAVWHLLGRRATGAGGGVGKWRRTKRVPTNCARVGVRAMQRCVFMETAATVDGLMSLEWTPVQR